MSDAAVPALPAVPGNTRLGDWIHRGFEAFSQNWQALIVQTLIAGVIALAAGLCLVLPLFLVLGPLSCGLHYCGLQAVRGNRIDGESLQRGWTMAGRSMVAWLALQVLTMIPAILLYALFGGAFFAMSMSGVMLPPRPVRAIAPAPPRPVPVLPQALPARTFEDPGDAEPAADPSTDAPTSKPDADHADGKAEADISEGPMNAGPPAAAPPFGAPPVGGPMRVQPPPAFFAALFAMYGLMMLGGLAMIVWQLWFTTRTMYAMPLIADRGYSAMEAITESWRLTKSRFWELLLINFLGGFVAMLGVYACYVGMVATLPIYFTLIAAAYEGDALRQFTPEKEPEAT